MNGRHTAGLVLSLLTLPVLALALLDPIEGGPPLIVGGVLVLVTWLVSRIPVPLLEWISWLATVGVGAAAIAGAAWVIARRGYVIPGPDGQPWWVLALALLYEVGVVITIIGGVKYAVRHARAFRSERRIAHA